MVQAGLDFVTLLALTFLSAGITDMPYHIQLGSALNLGYVTEQKKTEGILKSKELTFWEMMQSEMRKLHCT